MAGRGRGRGKSLSFNVESLGFGRGEALPGPIQQPPPLFPPVDFKPVSLLEDDAHSYLLALKQEFRATVKELPYYLQHEEKKRDIERYSDKYQSNQQENGVWEPDWRRLPAELKPKTKKVKRLTHGAKPNLSARKRGGNVDVSKTLEELEQKEKVDDGKGEADEEEENKDEEGQAEEEYYEEEDLEEETDYNMTYFDNGEGYGMDDEDDALDDGPVY